MSGTNRESDCDMFILYKIPSFINIVSVLLSLPSQLFQSFFLWLTLPPGEVMSISYLHLEQI